MRWRRERRARVTKKKAPTNPYDQYRAQAYDSVADRNEGRINSLTEVVLELMSLGNGADVDALKRSAAWEAVLREDQRRTSPSRYSDEQPNLFGWPDTEDAFWKLGEGERVRVREARVNDHTRHLRLAEENEQQVIDSVRQTRERYYRLLPYYLAGAKTVAQAVAAMREDEQRKSEAQTTASVGAADA
jgi:hypothetical protein